jgi:hypothetical protein
MLRTIFMIGLFAILGLFLLKVAFGLFGFLFVILLWLLKWALIIGVIGAAIYLVVRLVSPDTASRFRSRWSGP